MKTTHVFLQGTGRYAIYIANYANGNVGPHALIEMDEAASDLSEGVVALSNVAEQAGVNKLIGECQALMGTEIGLDDLLQLPGLKVLLMLTSAVKNLPFVAIDSATKKSIRVDCLASNLSNRARFSREGEKQEESK